PNHTSSSPVSDQISGPCAFGTFSVAALAGPGILGGAVSVTHFGAGNASQSAINATFSAPFTIVDPVNEAVGISMNLFFGGSVIAVLGGQAVINVGTTFGEAHWDLDTGSFGSFLLPPPNTSGIVTTPTIFLPTNVQQTLFVSLQ